MKKTYPAIFISEENGFSVIFPEFSGGTQGKDLEDAMYQAKEMLDGLLSFYIEENLPLPKPSDIHYIQTENKTSFVTLIQGDPTRFLEKKTIRKNVTIPEWLAVRGEKDGVNFSQMLTESLFEKYAHI
ncbi:type II toxin-antitoxin system HicB family antitoxin [uncultured Enterococcus sp.]|uniref:type II toxin-antitoxin system HicB family antitoxin n=1 Tax=uncultured Enterococcus sp. TaxID=167972 RepID=UPI00262E0A3A|nr:type II toxin-antitoxin system HicB family antitoxin [uncultured Enterococcus sp.]